MPPTLSILIPLWNDTEVLGRCLPRLRAPDAPPSEIIICDATSDSGEKARVRSLATAHNAHVLASPQPSRGAQLAAAAAAATGEILVFSHADTQLEGRHLIALRERFHADPSLQAGAFHRDVCSLYPTLAWATPVIHWYMAELGTLYGDQSPFIRRSTLHRLGGYPPLPLMEDMAFSRHLRHHLSRHELALLLPTLPTSPRRFQRHGRLRTKALNLAATTAWRLGLASPTQLHQWYYPSHHPTHPTPELKTDPPPPPSNPAPPVIPQTFHPQPDD